MGNQARQRQELEMWQVVGSSGNRNVRTRSAQPKKSDMQRRGNASSSNRTRVAKPAGTVRTGSQRSRNTAGTGAYRRTDQISMIDPNMPRTARRSGMERAGASRTGNRTTRAVTTGAQRTSAVRMQPARVVRRSGIERARYAEQGGQRTSAPRKRANPQALRKKKARQRARTARLFAFVWIMAMSAAIFFMGKVFYQDMQKSPIPNKVKAEVPIEEEIPVVNSSGDTLKPVIREDFLTISEYNRPGTPLACVKNIFVHYTANQGTSAAQNRSYFENLGQTHERAASAHFIIGYEGEIVQCIPLEEEAYAVVERNGDSISIECCYLEKDGSFTQETYDSLIKMLAWLTNLYDLEPRDILRHYDCGGKKCPIYYVEHEDAWQQLLKDVEQYIKGSL